MTDQPAAAPTPGRRGSLICAICGQDGLMSIGDTSDYEHNYTECAAAERDHLKKDRNSWKMLADSTNARCDRLKVVNEKLVKALDFYASRSNHDAKVLQSGFGRSNVSEDGGAKAHTALNEAHKP